jgi:hypothetical protein
MSAGDIPVVAELMTAAFCWPRGQWLNALHAMLDRESPAGYPRFGYVLELDGRVAGAILTIFTTVRHDGVESVRCNVSSWYVVPEARGYGPRLTRQVLQHRDVTLIDVSPMPHTRRFIETCGFQRYTEGQFACLPALHPGGRRVRVRPFRGEDAGRLRDPTEAALLSDHAGYGCLSLVCETPDGLTPFVFALRPLKRTPLERGPF